MKTTGTSAGPDALRADVERTRHELGDTVEALAAKADVRARAQAKADRVRGQLRDRADRAKGRARRSRHPEGGGTGRGTHGHDAVTVHETRRKPTVRGVGRDKRQMAVAAAGVAAVAALVGRQRFCHRAHTRRR